MDVVNSVRSCLATWNKGGESECRNILISPHCNPSNSECLDVLTTAYHTLLASVLSTWLPEHTLSLNAFVDFVQSVLNDLPSSSSISCTTAFTNASIFGEHLVDVLWSVDAELDETLGDARLTITASADQGAPTSTVLAKAKKAKQNAENDKEKIQHIVRRLLECGIINPESCRERLDSAVLASVGLISDKASLDKKEIRTRTGLFYKQNKFNLLREQSEGYSKLTVELTSSLGLAHSAQTGRPTETYTAIEDRARPVWEKVISLIGYFDLDPNRALDIILDVLSIHLATHYTFFLALLSFSPWCALYRPPKPKEDSVGMNVDLPTRSFTGKTFEEVLSSAAQGGPAPSSKTSSPRVLAQVLGFKFVYYQSPDVVEAAPRNLYLTAAVLIREGFITLEDLYSHLLPLDEDMDNDRKEYISNVQSRISGAKISQLAMSAPLESNGSSHSKSKAATPIEQKKPDVKDTNQKVGILNALLSVGAMQPAIAIMSKFPWLVDAHPEIADLMIRVMKASLSPLYDSLLITKERNLSFTQARARYGASGVTYPNPRKPILTLWAPTPPSTSTTDFIFFFPDWSERVPISSSLDDLETVIEPMMRFIGLHVSRDPLFLTKFLRLGRLHLQSTVPIDPQTKKPNGEPDPDNHIRLFWFQILRMYLLPALPLIRGNAVCTVEVWNIIRQYETTVRWRLYGEWKTTTYKSHPELRIREVQADRESKGILRRLSHNTIDSLSGTVAKLAHSNPCIFFANAVNQIMAYDNLANVVIQALRYVTNMGFDVLVFIILDALANPRKERVKDDGVNTSDWLQSLASFTGMLFRRYSADLTPVLKYIVHQLHNGQTTEIVVLRELIWKMAGIEPLPSLSEAQIAAMAGGPTLRIEAIASSTRGARLDPGDAVLKGPQRLGKGLLDSSLALPLLIQVAQQRQACVYKAPDAHLKSLAGLYDATHGVLLQYLELLTSPSVVSPQDYANKVIPSIAELAECYGLCAPICMQIIRPVLHTSLLSSALAMQEQERVANEEVEKRLKAALLTKREPGTAASRVASPAIGTPASEISAEAKQSTDEPSSTDDIPMEVDITAAPIIQNTDSPWLPELAALFDDIKKIAPGNAYDVIGPGFYLTFWQLSTYDLVPPSTRYNEEGAALRILSRQEDSKYIAADRSADRSKRLTASSHRTRRDRYNHFINTLAQEFKEQTISRAFTMKRLAREKQHWFAQSTKAMTLVNSLIEHCIQPRCLLSPMDADFCAQFIKVMHTQGTPGFHTLMCYDKLLGDHVKVVLFSCSEYEARNYGRFLLGILSDLHKWHLDEAVYMQDSRTKIGGKTVLHPGLQRTFSNRTVQADSLLKWDGFRQVFRKWHRKLAKCFVECIQTGEFMHVYNAIIVLKEIITVFPLAEVTDTGSGLDVTMDRFLETEDRGDLKILGRAYSASLKKRESLWAMPKLPGKPNGNVSPMPSTSGSSPSSEKVKSALPPSGPVSQSASLNDGRRSAVQPSSTPSAPRAQLATASTSAQSTVDKPTIGPLNSAKLAMESIPRPEVVKRVRPDRSDSPKLTSDASILPKTDLTAADRKVSSLVSADARDSPSSPRFGSPANIDAPRYHSTASLPSYRLADDKTSRLDSHPDMPPPSVPSQTASAQELRETARQSIRPDKVESRSQNGSAAPSPRLRSPSPSSRPGTRNGSSDSRASGGRSRSDRGNADGGSDERRSDRESRHDTRDATTLGRRDSLTHNRGDRPNRERTSTRESDRDRDDKDRGRDRHSDRDREKDRERDRDRDRDRDRERDRDRDRHRRDEKDRERDGRKDRDGTGTNRTSTIAPQDDRGLPTRPDLSRHRHPLQNGDDGLGKRRRPADDDPERGSKRSSRKEGHRDERGRRFPEKDGHDRTRESDRRRKDRDSENEGRASSLDKMSEKRIPDGPSSSKILPPSTPSAPRAMASGADSARSKADQNSGRERNRDTQHKSSGPSSIPQSTQQDSGPKGVGSLRSRIGEKEIPPSAPLSSPIPYRNDPLRSEEDRDGGRKRTASDREKESSEVTPGPDNDQATQAPKRPRIIRNRYNSQNSHAIARKLLPIDPLAGDKSQRRQD